MEFFSTPRILAENAVTKQLTACGVGFCPTIVVFMGLHCFCYVLESQALSAMVKLELPHVNILTKMDICENKVPT